MAESDHRIGARVSVFRTLLMWCVGMPWTGLMASLSVLASLFPQSGYLIHHCARIWGHGLLWLTGVKVEIKGLEHIPSEGSVLVVSNHQGVFDIILFASCIPMRIAWIAKRELFEIPIFGTALHAAGYIPVDRGKREKAISSLKKAALKIKNRSVVIFPEGTRTRTGKMGPFKSGVTFLANESRAPVLPVTITNSYERNLPGSKWIAPGTIHVYIDELIQIDNLEKKQIQSVIDDIHQRMTDRVNASFEYL